MHWLCTVMNCNELYCTVLYCTILYHTVLYCTILLIHCISYCIVLYCIVMYCILEMDLGYKVLSSYPSYMSQGGGLRNLRVVLQMSERSTSNVWEEYFKCLRGVLRNLIWEEYLEIWEVYLGLFFQYLIGVLVPWEVYYLRRTILRRTLY